MKKYPKVRDDFYDTLESVLNKFSERSHVYICGDFNVKTGTGYRMFSKNMRKNGKRKINSNGQHLLEFANRNSLILSNTLFQHKMAHRTTWIGPERINSNTKIPKNQIDYIMGKTNEREYFLDSSLGSLF